MLSRFIANPWPTVQRLKFHSDMRPSIGAAYCSCFHAASYFMFAAVQASLMRYRGVARMQLARAESEPAIVAEGLCKSYQFGRLPFWQLRQRSQSASVRWALKDITFEVGKG